MTTDEICAGIKTAFQDTRWATGDHHASDRSCYLIMNLSASQSLSIGFVRVLVRRRAGACWSRRVRWPSPVRRSTCRCTTSKVR